MTRSLDRSGPAALLGRPSVLIAMAALAAPGAETRLVGGCVRDCLLGTAAADIDLATTLLPEQTMARAAEAGLKAVPTGIEHGTITLVAAGEPVEVTTLREDVETDGRHAVVRFGRDFARDAERRDFTINALTLDSGGQLHDTVGGIADLEAGRVRFIGDAPTRIREDALRILRFFRFHARFGLGEPDPNALTACIAARDSLDGLSKERVRTEFLKLLMAERGVPVVSILADTGLLQRITGGVGELGRLARAAKAAMPASLRLAALAVHTHQDAERLREGLRLSKAEVGELAGYAGALAALHDRAQLDVGEARALTADHGAHTVAATLAILRGEPRPALSAEAQQEIARLRAGGRDPVFPVIGADLVQSGIRPGRAIGQGLAVARAEWLRRGCPEDADSRTELLAIAQAAAQ